MENYEIYKDIAGRTQGDIYIGVVGPVRTGKSTFIKKFMDKRVLPNIENTYVRERARDELPQSADGKTIMTTEPKFVPDEAVEISLSEGIACSVRMIDCVGYVVEGAEGHTENDSPRMVSTPWSDKKIPFSQAAETGTRKVIREHSTIAVAVFADESVTGIDRKNYQLAEDRVVKELKEINKPFVIVLNSAEPQSEEAKSVAENLHQKYGVTVKTVNCTNLTENDIDEIMTAVLYEFPLTEVRINLPVWIDSLDNDSEIKSGIIENVKQLAENISALKEVENSLDYLTENDNIKRAYVEDFDSSTGVAKIVVDAVDELFYDVISQMIGIEVEDEFELVSTIKQLSRAKTEYDKIKFALEEAERSGYGIVSPPIEEIKIEKPQVIKQGGRYGIKINATAPSIHLIKAEVEASISPIVGSEQQSEELVKTLTGQYGDDIETVMNYSIFGRSIGELINDDINTKLLRMPEDTRQKFKTTIQKIVNEGSGGMICILL
jgi:stage IV sporulation protein A